MKKLLSIEFLSLTFSFLILSTPTPAIPSETAILVVAEEHIGGYSRDSFKHWIDADGNGCNTRLEVLIQEAIVKPKVTSGCRLVGGKWKSIYDEKSYTNPSLLDIDHLVPLNEAWRSGAWNWNSDKRMKYANDLDEKSLLLAVTASLNRSKSDKDIRSWVPSKNKCLYLKYWISVKVKYSLSVDVKEVSAIQKLSSDCGVQSPLFVSEDERNKIEVSPNETSSTMTSPASTAAPQESKNSIVWPEGASARCKDGVFSYSKTRSGTCSGHGGVAIWRQP